MLLGGRVPQAHIERVGRPTWALLREYQAITRDLADCSKWYCTVLEPGYRTTADSVDELQEKHPALDRAREVTIIGAVLTSYSYERAWLSFDGRRTSVTFEDKDPARVEAMRTRFTHALDEGGAEMLVPPTTAERVVRLVKNQTVQTVGVTVLTVLNVGLRVFG